MIPIYICEDDPAYLNAISDMIKKTITLQDYDMKLQLATHNPCTLLKNLEGNLNRSIYFLDVDLKHRQLDGFKLGKEIRKLDTRGFIIYITAHSELSFETFRYRIEAMDYIVKDYPHNIENRIRQCLDSVQDRMKAETNDNSIYYSVKVLDKIHHIPVNEILFFETSSSKHRLILHTEDRQLEFYGNLQEVEETTGSLFIRTHRAYLVNKENINSYHIKNGFLTLINGQQCLVSRQMKKAISLLNK